MGEELLTDEHENTAEQADHLTELQEQLDEQGAAVADIINEANTDDASDIPQEQPGSQDAPANITNAAHEVPEANMASDSSHADVTPDPHANDMTPNPHANDNGSAPESVAVPPVETEQDVILQNADEMRASAFGRMVAASRQLPERKSSIISQATGLYNKHSEFVSGAVNEGLAGYNLYAGTKVALDMAQGKNKLAPSEKNRDWKDMTISILKGLLLGVLAINRARSLFTATDKGASKSLIKATPSLLKTVSIIVNSVGGALKENSSMANNMVNFTTAVNSFMATLDLLVDYFKLKTRLEKFDAVRIKTDGKTAIKENISRQIKKTSWLMLSNTAQAIGEITHAFVYAANPQSNATMITKIVSSGINIAHNVHADQRVRLRDQRDANENPTQNPVSNAALDAVQKFTSLTEDAHFLGDDAIPDTLANNSAQLADAYQEYKDFHDDMAFYGISVRELQSVDSKEAQASIIKNAIGF